MRRGILLGMVKADGFSFAFEVKLPVPGSYFLLLCSKKLGKLIIK